MNKIVLACANFSVHYDAAYKTGTFLNLRIRLHTKDEKPPKSRTPQILNRTYSFEC